MSQRYTNVPDNLQPIGPWKYFGLSILYSIPVLGLVFLIIHSISRANINRRNYARSFFCIIALVLIITLVSVLITGVDVAVDYIKNVLNA